MQKECTLFIFFGFLNDLRLLLWVPRTPLYFTGARRPTAWMPRGASGVGFKGRSVRPKYVSDSLAEVVAFMRSERLQLPTPPCLPSALGISKCALEQGLVARKSWSLKTRTLMPKLTFGVPRKAFQCSCTSFASSLWVSSLCCFPLNTNVGSLLSMLHCPPDSNPQAIST